VAYWENNIGAALATITTDVHYVLSDLGVNDFASGLPDETTWKANYQSIIDDLRARWSSVQIYITKPWSRNHDSDATTMAGWIDDLVAANSGVCFVSDNENTWLKGADDGATMTTDGIHYSATGNAEKITRVVTALGY